MSYPARYFWGGILTLALGVIVLFNAAFASGAIVVVTGLVLLIGGGAQIALGFLGNDAGSRKWLGIILGVLTVFLGWSFLSNPLSGVISLTTFLLILLAASGILQIVFGYRTRGTDFFWPLMIAGGVSLALALFILSSPTATTALLGIVLGIHLLALGSSLTMMGMFLKRAGKLIN